MSKDYKPLPGKAAAKPEAPKGPASKGKPGGKGSPLMIGLLIGLLVGIAMSVVVALSVKNSGNPFQEKAPQAPEIAADASVKPSGTPATEGEAPDNSGQISSESKEPAESATPADTATDKSAAPEKKEDRFTFYGILTENTPPAPIPEPGKPGSPATTNTPSVPSSPSAPGTPKAVGERYFLQVGAYKTEQDADNTKAKLSLIGLDAVLQTVTLPDKGVLHRVRVGPLTSQDELSRVKAELARNGFSAEPVKVQE